mgnify:CR=1 FL=1
MKRISKEELKVLWSERKELWKQKKEVLKQKKEIRRQKRAERIEKRKNSKFGKAMGKACVWMNRFSLLMHALLSAAIYFVIEAISRHSVVKAWNYMLMSPWTFLFNTYMIFASFLIVYIVRRRVFARVIIGVVWMILGIVNGYMLSVRVTPFNAQDLKVIDDAVTMLDKYFNGVQGVLIIAAIVAVITWLVYMWKNAGIFQGKMHRIIAAIVAVAGIGAIAPLTEIAINNRVVSDYFGNIAFAYEDYGLPYCFGASVLQTGMELKKDSSVNYSKETIAEINKDGILTDVSTTREEMPNIILIQLESFFDPAEVEFFTTSEDPIPTFRYLMNNYSSGYFKVPSVGAGTANTEFEVLTGMNLRYFGPGEYPYKTMLKYEKNQTESVATALKAFGYGAHALHNNGGNFYSRADVFNNIGFDSYTSKEFMNILQMTENGWAKDDVLTQHILNSMDSTEQQDFVFTITVQGHGDYPEEKVIENPRILVDGIEEEGLKNSWEYLVNHLYETDQFIADLISELERRGEPTVLILYGDHLPTMGLEAKDLKNRYLYNTNYAIWDNIGLEKVNKNLPTYQLMATVFERLGIHSGTIFNYHQARRQTKNYLSDLELLQYDMLFGDNYVYGGKDYKINREGEFQMGILDVSLFGMQANLDGTYSFYGENMTANSKVYVNGEKQSTQFLNNTRIELKGIDLEEGDIIVVNQVGSSSRVFRSSVEYAYSQGNLVLASEYVPPVEPTEGDAQPPAEGEGAPAEGTEATVGGADGPEKISVEP